MIPSLVRSAGNRSGRDTSQMRAVRVLQLAALTWVVGACSDGVQELPLPQDTGTGELATLDGAWGVVAALPVGVQDVGVAVYRGQIYVVGGAGVVTVPDATGTSSQLCCAAYATVQRYDPTTNAWTQLADLPEVRRSLALGVVGDTLYAVGGIRDHVGQPGGTEATLWAYLPETDEWAERTPLPEPRSGATAVSVLGQLYVIGGISAGFTRIPGDSIAIYDPATALWRHAAPVPGGIVDAVAHNVDGLVYLIGGNDPINLSDGSRSILTYDPAGDTWATLIDTPGFNEMFRSAVLNGRLHLVGGLMPGGEYHRVYDIASGEWLKAPDLRSPRRDHAAVALNARLYLIGGLDGVTDNPTTTVHVFNLQ